MTANRLAGESSPYLRQHADNPVDWFPWGDEALHRARVEDKPVFLSIGYSACHWCHVMAHESFEDPEIGQLLARDFIAVKVDREERPDIDAVYMEAVQALTGSGGWPLSVFLTPDGRPFFGGTYFPPDDHRGRPSFKTVLTALADVWQNRRGDVEEQADELVHTIASRSTLTRQNTSGPPAGQRQHGGLVESGSTSPLPVVEWTPVCEELQARFDAEWGGFGGAPKFPQPTLVDLALLGAANDPGARTATTMACRTLDAMAAGGIHDHLSGGFARYATDREWLVPHFEKMLYDQAGLLTAYLHGWQATGDPGYLEVMDGIVNYVTRDLTGPAGEVFSAEDADSEGVEGRFYVWTPTEIHDALARNPRTSGDAAARTRAILEFFSVTEEGNFEGSNILRRPVGAQGRGDDSLEVSRSALRDERARRVRPGLDDKVLLEWNAMYGSALAEAAAATATTAWAVAAEKLGDFLWHNLRGDDGRWHRSWQSMAGARHLACAADYASTVDFFTRLGELTGERRWTDRACEVADGLLHLFHDTVDGGFFTTGHDAEALIVRTKDLFDGATPSANAVAARALLRLGTLTGRRAYLDASEGVIELLGDLVVTHPLSFAHTLITTWLTGNGMVEVVIPGLTDDLLAEARRAWRPSVVLAWGEATDSPLWENRVDGLAYVCRNFSCRHPAADGPTLAAQLADTAIEVA